MDLENIREHIITFGNNLVEAQERFVQSDLYGIFNSALDTGIRIALPEVAEDIVIGVKDTLMENGFQEGAKQIWDGLKNAGKSIYGLVSGKFETIEQLQTAAKTGGVLDILSSIFDFALDKAVDNEKITKSTKQSIKVQKNSIIKDIKSRVSEDLDKQVGYVEKINEHSEKWQTCYEKEDLKGMKNANKNIQKYLEKTLPLENVLKKARKIEIMQKLIESTGRFQISEEEKELATALAQ